MRTKLIIVLAVLVITAIVGLIWLAPATPHAGPWKLADGSEVSLAGVTYGKFHRMRYGNSIADYLYPVLTPTLRSKFACKVMTLPTADTNAIVVWLWDRGVPVNPTAPGFTPFNVVLTTADSNGMVSWFPAYPNASVVWRRTNILYAIELHDYPRRSPEFDVRLNGIFGRGKPLGEFELKNRAWTNYPVWTPMSLPVTARTNGLEVSLVKFETRPNERGNLSITHLGFNIADGKPAFDELAIRRVAVSSATGQFRESTSATGTSALGKKGATLVADVGGALWPEEPAWKVTAEFWRLINFPATELWTVKNVTVPELGRTLEVHATTNIYGSEIELMTIKRWASNTNESTQEIVRDPAVLQVMSPIPSPDIHLRVAGVTDDRGRPVDFYFENETQSTGGRGATIRELRKYYTLAVAPDAKSVDVTLAYSKSVSVEFIAKPTVAK